MRYKLLGKSGLRVSELALGTMTVEGSLKRLNTEFIDLLWLHAWDGMTPVEEVLRGWSSFVALQLPYSLAGRDPERDLLPMAKAHQVTPALSPSAFRTNSWPATKCAILFSAKPLPKSTTIDTHKPFPRKLNLR